MKKELRRLDWIEKLHILLAPFGFPKKRIKRYAGMDSQEHEFPHPDRIGSRPIFSIMNPKQCINIYAPFT